LEASRIEPSIWNESPQRLADYQFIGFVNFHSFPPISIEVIVGRVAPVFLHWLASRQKFAFCRH
jgi:hypothetical protein